MRSPSVDASPSGGEHARRTTQQPPELPGSSEAARLFRTIAAVAARCAQSAAHCSERARPNAISSRDRCRRQSAASAHSAGVRFGRKRRTSMVHHVICRRESLGARLRRERRLEIPEAIRLRARSRTPRRCRVCSSFRSRSRIVRMAGESSIEPIVRTTGDSKIPRMRSLVTRGVASVISSRRARLSRGAWSASYASRAVRPSSYASRAPLARRAPLRRRASHHAPRVLPERSRSQTTLLRVPVRYGMS